MTIKNPLFTLPKNSQQRFFGLFFGLTVVIMVVFGVTGSPLNTEAAPSGIISFELASSEDRSEAVLSSWNEGARERAAFGLGLDFLYIPVYVAAISLGCALASKGIESRKWPMARVGQTLAWGVCFAGLLDIIENIALLVILFGEGSTPWSQISAGCAIVKFSLIFLALVHTLYGGAVSLVIKAP